MSRHAKLLTAPRLVYSPLGKRVYVVTRYRLRPLSDGSFSLVASRKYDVTDDFAALRKKRLKLGESPR